MGEEDLFVWARMPVGEDRVQFQFWVIKQIILAVERVIYKIEHLCTFETCPRMIASDEWHFLCAPHADKPRDCSAIDYMKHTVDSTTNCLLAHSSYTVLHAATVHAGGLKQFPSIIRRLYRIYGHVYFHHVEIFNEEYVSCARFYHFLKQFGLFKSDMMIIPENVFQTNTNTCSPGTIVDLRAVTIQLSLDEDEESSEGGLSVDTTVM